MRATDEDMRRLGMLGATVGQPPRIPDAEPLPTRKSKYRVNTPVSARKPARRESEKSFQKRVISLAKLHGWRVAHFRPAQNARGDWRTPVAADGKGFPDLVMVRDGDLIFAELKAKIGRLSTEQQEWLNQLNKTHGVTVCVWRPSDWELIVELLGAKQ
jgi:hypothetical protein